MCADFETCHESSFGVSIQRQHWIAGITSLLIARNAEKERRLVTGSFLEWYARKCPIEHGQLQAGEVPTTNADANRSATRENFPL
jgi:hypothetical protein